MPTLRWSPTGRPAMAGSEKQQNLQRRFGLVSVLSLTTSVMVTWEGICIAFQSGFNNGGPSGLVYGFILTWFGILSQILVAAEMASMIPLSGGQYNWVAVLATPKLSKLLSYFTGWSTFIGWQASCVATAYAPGTIIQGILILNYASYEPQPWHGVLLAYAVLLLSFVINTGLGQLLPKIESFVLLVQVIGFIGILIPVVYLSPSRDASFVFNNLLNEGDWPTQGLSFMIGLTTSMTAFIGIDASAHIGMLCAEQKSARLGTETSTAEEVQDAPRVVPQSMLWSVAINGLLGFGILLAILFSINDIEAALASPTQYPIIEVFRQGLKSVHGATALVAVLVVCSALGNIGMMAAASRMTWAFAREKALPGHHYLSYVHPGLKLPVWSILLTASISALVILINLGSSIALNAFNSLAISGFYTSFILSASVILYRRVFEPQTLIMGPFQLGRFGTAITVFSILYSLQGVFFTFWPPQANPSLDHFNWAPMAYVGFLLVATGFWIIWGRKIYDGPVRPRR